MDNRIASCQNLARNNVVVRGREGGGVGAPSPPPVRPRQERAGAGDDTAYCTWLANCEDHDVCAQRETSSSSDQRS